MQEEHTEYEKFVASLNDDTTRLAYQTPLDTYRPGLIPRLVGGILVLCGNAVYGKAPSYLKFRAIEVIARVPYHSWVAALFTTLTLLYSDEQRALNLSTLSRFAQFAAENETMHVVVISQLARAHSRAGFIRYTFIPILFAFGYFWFSYVLYLIHPRWSLEINYLFEQHAYIQYSLFLETCGAELKRCAVESAYLEWYGRPCRSEYDFFCLVRNDELIHRNRSVHEISLSH
jgi:hypothetical protein